MNTSKVRNLRGLCFCCALCPPPHSTRRGPATSLGLFGPRWGLFGAWWASSGRFGRLWSALGLWRPLFRVRWGPKSSAGMGSGLHSDHVSGRRVQWLRGLFHRLGPKSHVGLNPGLKSSQKYASGASDAPASGPNLMWEWLRAELGSEVTEQRVGWLRGRLPRLGSKSHVGRDSGPNLQEMVNGLCPSEAQNPAGAAPGAPARRAARC